MILVAHIAIALTSIAYTTYLYFRPSPDKFSPAYWLVGLTIASGSVLIISSGAHILRGCIAGLAYIGAVTFAIQLAKRKLARENRKI